MKPHWVCSFPLAIAAKTQQKPLVSLAIEFRTHVKKLAEKGTRLEIGVVVDCCERRGYGPSMN